MSADTSFDFPPAVTQTPDLPPLDLALLYRVIGGRDNPRGLLRRSRHAHWGMPALVYSVFKREGIPLSRETELEYTRLRHRRLLFNDIARAAGGTVVKGSSIAQKYPEGLDRHVGDLDIEFADEYQVWRAARVIAGLWPVRDVQITYFSYPRQVIVTLRWPSSDPLLELDYYIDLCTRALTGDGRTLPVLDLPAHHDSVTRDTLAVAHERLERPLRPTDAIDLLALSTSSWSAVLDAARFRRLGPELAELFEYAAALLDSRTLAHLGQLLQPVASEEIQRRRDQPPFTVNPDASSFESGLRSGIRWNSYPLVESITTNDAIQIPLVYEDNDGVILRTCLGDFLLCAQDTVKASAVHRARANIAALAQRA